MARPPQRRQAQVFGEVAATYHRIRPDFPGSLLADIVAAAAPVNRVLDVGAGTGKLTDAIIDLVPHLDVLDPDADMMAELLRRHDGRIGRCYDATFEEADLTDGTYDLLVAGQSWHWVDPERGAGTARRTLRRGGTLALLWNRPEPDAGPLRDAIDEAYDRHAPGLSSRTPGSRGREFAAEAMPLPEAEHFDWQPPISLPRTIDYSVRDYVDLMATQSNHRLLEPDALDALLEGIASAIESIGGGTYGVQYTTVAVVGRSRA